jgi:hypothetical protein
VPETPTVKDALSRLARRPAGTPSLGSDRFGSDDYRTVVATAEEAAASGGAATDFLAADGLARLDAAIEAAAAADDHAAARRGRQARDVLSDFLTAVRSDQFHSGRGTTLGGGAQGDENDTGDTYG